MTAVISTTCDPKYIFYLPITTWLWNKLDYKVICFMPRNLTSFDRYHLYVTVSGEIKKNGLECEIRFLDCPEHKEATYAQCSRLYAAALPYLDSSEGLITSDIDMAVFKKLSYISNNEDKLTVFGSDLTPENQFPICYISGTVDDWRRVMGIVKIDYQTLVVSRRTVQQCLDDLLGGIECTEFRGNFWQKDQETLWKHAKDRAILIPRAMEGTQLASNRLDREDGNLLNRLSLDIIDYHMSRPGYEDANFNVILTVLKFYYPNEDFTWLMNYQQRFKELL